MIRGGGIDSLLFGLGGDGTFEIAADAALSEDLYADLVIIDHPVDNVTVQTLGSKIVARSKVYVGPTSTVTCSGFDAVNEVAGTGATFGTLGGGQSGQTGYANVDHEVTDVGAWPRSLSGDGGRGGKFTALTVFPTGAGGVSSMGAEYTKSWQGLWTALTGFAPEFLGTLTRLQGGAGGGMGQGALFTVPGGGGGGGGVMLIAAPEIEVDGAIWCNGGRGGNATVPNTGGGGGGGGSGGLIILVYGTLIVDGVILASGGDGGDGLGSGLGGIGGGSGFILHFTPTYRASYTEFGLVGSTGADG